MSKAPKAQKRAKLKGRTMDIATGYMDISAKIKALRERFGESQAAFGKRVGVEQATVSRWELGEMPARRLWDKIASLAGQTKGEFFLGEVTSFTHVAKSDSLADRKNNDSVTESPSLGGDTDPQEIDIAGAVGAGDWREVEETGESMGAVLAIRSPRYPRAKYVAFLVDGDSMDLLGIHNGFHVIAVDYVDAGASMQTGDIVVVEESRDGGHLIRRTLKEVHVFRDRYELRPRSSNLTHKPIVVPIDYFDAPGRDIRVLAIVLQATKLFSRAGD